MELYSDKTIVQKDQKTCFRILSQPENYKRLMPENTEKFEINSEGGFDFQLKGMPEIFLKEAERHPYYEVNWASRSEKFYFMLTVKIAEVSPGKSQIHFFFKGEFNAMVAMMIKNPLKKFINTLQLNLKEI